MHCIASRGKTRALSFPASGYLPWWLATLALWCGTANIETAQAATTSLHGALTPTAGLIQPASSGNPPLLAQAPQAMQVYQIAAGPLDDALASFGRTAGVLMTYDTRLAAGHQTRGLSGRYSIDTGLAVLLAGTGLEARRTPEGHYVLRRAPQNSQPVELRPVVVQGAKRDLTDLPYKTAGSSSVLTREHIERFRGTSVGDIFQGVPGVLVSENRNSGGLDVNIRGMQGQGRVPVLVDGSRQETTVYRGYAGVSSRSYVDPDLIGGIQIEKGPVMGAQGAGAVGGLVSMRTLSAEDIVRPGQTFGMRMRASLIGNNSGSAPEPGTPAGYNVGSNSQYRINCRIASLCEGDHDIARAQASDESMDRPGLLRPKSFAGSLAVAKRLESADLVAAYARRNQGNYYAGTKGPVPYLDLSDTTNRGFYTEVRPRIEGATRFRGGERIVNSNYDSESVLLKARLYLPREQELELSYLRYESTYGELMPSQLIWLGAVRQTSNSHVTAHTYTSRYRWNPDDAPLLNLSANLWHTDTSSQNRNYSEDQWSDMFDIGDERYKRWGADISNTMQINRLGGFEISYGLSLQTEKVNSAGEASTFSGGGRVGRRNEYSLFTNAQWTPVESLTFNAGLRYTRYRSRDDKPYYVSADSEYCVDTDGDGTCDPIMRDSRYSGSAPMFSVLWEPLDGLQFYARHAEALRMPSLFETTAGFSVSPSQDIHLKPERATSREIGVNLLQNDLFVSGDKFRAKLAMFRNHTRDYLTRTYPNTWEEGSGQQFFSLRNIESVRFHGVELSGSYDMGAMFVEVGGTRYNFIETCHFGSYRRSTCTDFGIAASYVNNMIPPKWHASATLGVRLLERRLTLGVRGTFMGQRTPTPQYNDQGVATDGFASPVPWHKYNLWDVFASYSFNDQVTLDFNIDNLTDQYYLDALSLGLVPAPGRSARLSLTLRY